MNNNRTNKLIPFFTVLLLVFLGTAAVRAFAVPGDADASGAVTIVDALQVARYYVGTLAALPDPSAAEVNCDGRVDIVDALLIARYYVGLEAALGACGQDYPTTIAVLPSATVRALQSEFDALNGNAIVAQIDQFGFTSASFTMPYDRRPTGAPLADQNEVLRISRETLIANSKFTNVTATTLLDQYTLYQVPASNSYWIVTFTIDSYQGTTIPPVQIRLEFKTSVYFIMGHCPPPGIFVPALEAIDFEQAKASVIGTTITFYNIEGKPISFDIVEADVGGATGTRAIVTVEKTDRIEYRSCWVVLIAEGMWYIYVDVMTGESIAIEQNFQT